MPVIAFANSKGGSGKTTATLLLACQLARTQTVTVIDADPRQPITSWVKKRDDETPPPNFTLINNVNELNIYDVIDACRQTSDWLLVDLEGTASKLTGVATTSSDLIVIPCNEQIQDAEAAIDVIATLKRDFKQFRNTVPFSILFSRTRAVKGRIERVVSQQFRSEPSIPCLETELMQRDAYAQIFARGSTLYELPEKEVSNIEKAVGEVEKLAREIKQRLGVVPGGADQSQAVEPQSEKGAA